MDLRCLKILLYNLAGQNTNIVILLQDLGATGFIASAKVPCVGA